MKKYVVFVQDEIQSEAVQRELFKYGFGWDEGKNRNVCYTDKHFISINLFGGALTYGNSWDFVAESIEEGRIIPISVGRILNEAWTLDGAEKMIKLSNGKEVSEETILSLLRQAGEDA